MQLNDKFISQLIKMEILSLLKTMPVDVQRGVLELAGVLRWRKGMWRWQVVLPKTLLSFKIPRWILTVGASQDAEHYVSYSTRPSNEGILGLQFDSRCFPHLPSGFQILCHLVEYDATFSTDMTLKTNLYHCKRAIAAGMVGYIQKIEDVYDVVYKEAFHYDKVWVPMLFKNKKTWMLFEGLGVTLGVTPSMFLQYLAVGHN